MNLETSNAIIDGIRQAVEVAPDNLPLRRHLADLLFQAGQWAESEKYYREVLLQNPKDQALKTILAETFLKQEKWVMALVILEELIKAGSQDSHVYWLAAQVYRQLQQPKEAQTAYQQARHYNPSLNDPAFDTVEATPPSLIESLPLAAEPDLRQRARVEEMADEPITELEQTGITFKDVGGMEKLKEEIRLKIIHPLQHPEIYQAYGKNIGGGILMYGPPGCGKTHLARATAGEVNAYFLSIGIHDVLNMYIGQSEQNLHELFQMARRNRPCVLFIDEIDALGASRNDMRQSAGRHLINQLLSELDGIEAHNNDGILVMAATNAPWHLDSALRRPGRFDRLIFVPPPDPSARSAILQVLLKNKPTQEINYERIAQQTEGFSGADLKGLIDLAIEGKLSHAIRHGGTSPITTQDLERQLPQVKSSTQEWLASARNYALYANQGGTYDEILSYLKVEETNRLLPNLNFWKKK